MKVCVNSITDNHLYAYNEARGGSMFSRLLVVRKPLLIYIAYGSAVMTGERGTDSRTKLPHLLMLGTLYFNFITKIKF